MGGFLTWCFDLCCAAAGGGEWINLGEAEEEGSNLNLVLG